MAKSKSGEDRQQKSSFRFHVIIFFVGMLFTVTLWDSYFNGERPFDRELASGLILVMGTLFSFAAGMFAWSIESRGDHLEKQVEKRTRELNRKNSELHEKNQEVENFIHIISHDLKAPIVSIRGFADLLKEDLGENFKGSVADYCNRISTNARQMNTLILDLLEFSRVGRVEEDCEAVNSNELFQAIAATLRPEMDKRNIRVDLQEHLPTLWGSKKRLEQVFTNLFSNSVKYMGSPENPTIQIGGLDEGSNGLCKLWVKDNGVGIKKEFQDRIFQIFQRIPNPTKAEGTGVGLSIVKKIVELNGGTVDVESEEGKGSCFFVTWPKDNGRRASSNGEGEQKAGLASSQEKAA